MDTEWHRELRPMKAYKSLSAQKRRTILHINGKLQEWNKHRWINGELLIDTLRNINIKYFDGWNRSNFEVHSTRNNFPKQWYSKNIFSFDIVSHHTEYMYIAKAHTEFDVTTHRYICSHILHQFFWPPIYNGKLFCSC